MSKHITVDDIDFASVVRFPSLLGAVTASMQPPRLVVGFLLVAALMSVGRLYDAATAPVVASDGLLAPERSDADEARINTTLRDALVAYVPEETRPDGWDAVRLDANDVAGRVEAAYRARRSDRLTEETGAAWDEIARADARFLETMQAIEAVRTRGIFEGVCDASIDSVQRVVRGVLTLRPAEVFEGFAALFIGMPVAAWRADRLFTVAFGLVFLLLTALGGGALARMAACDFAVREKLRVVDGLGFAVASWRSLLLAPLLPLILAGGLALVIVALGLLMTVPVLDVVGALLYGVALLLGFLVAFLLLGYALAFPLLVPAVVSERCDAADAQQRAFVYLLARPAHLLLYMALGVVGFALGYVVVAGVATVMLDATAVLFGTFTTNTAATTLGGFSIFELDRSTPRLHTGTSSVAAAITSTWQTLVVGLVAGWVFSYYYASSARIYLLMRRVVDGQDPTEIWRPGLVPGTQVPVGAGVVPLTEPGRAERAVQAAMRAFTAMRPTGSPFRRDREEAPTAEVELGPEEVDENERRVGMKDPPRDDAPG